MKIVFFLLIASILLLGTMSQSLPKKVETSTITKKKSDSIEICKLNPPPKELIEEMNSYISNVKKLERKIKIVNTYKSVEYITIR